MGIEGLIKRILMISTHGYFEAKPSFGRADTGGQIVFVIELSREIAKLGYKVDILTRQFENFSQFEQINDDVRIVRIPCGGRDFIPKEFLVQYLPELVDGFTEYTRENNLSYEFIDSHYWDAGFVGMRLSGSFNIPYIFTPHSLGIWKEMDMKEAAKQEGKEIDEDELGKKYNFKQRNSTEKTIMENARKIIATTPEQKDIIHRRYSIAESRVKIITPGFFPEKYHKIDKDELAPLIKRYNLPEKYILSVGRITSYKGYNLLIEAFQHVAREVPDVSLVMTVGSDEPSDVAKRDILAKRAENLGIGDRIKFYGYVDRLEVFYNAAKLLVMPSTYEPFGMVAIESMACGTPAVVTSRGGLKAFLEDGKNALIVDPLNTEEMVQAIINLLKDKDLHDEIARNGYKLAHAKFTWKHIAESTLQTSTIQVGS